MLDIILGQRSEATVTTRDEVMNINESDISK